MVNQVEELQHGLEEQEREAVEAASQLERQQFLSVARALQPVLEQQAVLDYDPVNPNVDANLVDDKKFRADQR